MATEYTYAQVAEHNDRENGGSVWVVIHEKVYDCTKFIDEHPGGEEVMLDVAGQDATDAFEDVGHSDEAREVLEPLYIGELKRQPGDPSPSASAPTTKGMPSASTSDSSAVGTGLYLILAFGAVLAFGAYKFLNGKAPREVKI